MKRFISLLFLCLSFAKAKSNYRPCKLCIDRATPAALAAIELRLYTCSTLNDYTSVRVDDALNLLDKIDKSKSTAIYISGWLTNPDSQSVKALISAYLARGDHNIIILDWHEIAAQFFPFALSSVEGVGYTLATALNELVARGLSTSGLTIIGHSFGAQISAFTGKYVNFRVPRITGLDPAGPGFYGVAERLDSSDAEFVVIIHSDTFLYGINLSTGHVDFYPNGGSRPQPGCSAFGFPPFGKTDFCSHNRAIDYYTESVRNEEAFLSLNCDSYSKFREGLCLRNKKVFMGLATPITTRGDFYLETNNASLYDRGDDGLIYNKPGFF